MSNVLLALVLGLYTGVGIVSALGGVGINNVLWAGVVAGLCVGNPAAGFELGATCLLMSLGFYTYGGATIPDYTVGCIFGTVVAAKTGNADAGIVVATTLALLFSQMDILGRTATTVFQHLAEGALAKNNEKKFETLVLCGTLPWALSRAIPTFLGLLMIDNVTALANFANSFAFIANGLRLIGAALPAVGFALLVSYMDIKKYWPFMILGYVAYAYIGMGTLALALVGLALGALFMDKFVGGAE